MSERIDIGGGHEIEFVSFEDDPKTAINDYHKKPDGTPCQGFVSFKGGAWAKQFPDSGWDVISLEPLTLSPSLLCRTCGDHGHIRNGKWEKA
jgi:hypothetical protein